MSTKATAARIYEYGEPDVFRFETTDVPDPVGHEVLVRNTVIGLNFVDIYYRRGTLPVPELSPDWKQLRSESQVDAFTCFGRILNLLEELLLPDRIVECRNDLCSTGPISAQRHIQVAEFRCACL